MQLAITALERCGPVDLARVWAGVELASTASAAAFDAVIDVARGSG